MPDLGDQKLGLDASGMVETVKEVNAMWLDHKAKLEATVAAANQMGDALGDVTLRFSSVSDEGHKLSSTIAQISEDGEEGARVFKVISTNAAMAAKSIAENTEQLSKAQTAIKRYNEDLATEARLIAQINELEAVQQTRMGSALRPSPLDKELEQLRIQAQAELGQTRDKLGARATGKTEADRRSILAAEAIESKRLADSEAAIAKATEEAAEAAKAIVIAEREAAEEARILNSIESQFNANLNSTRDRYKEIHEYAAAQVADLGRLRALESSKEKRLPTSSIEGKENVENALKEARVQAEITEALRLQESQEQKLAEDQKLYNQLEQENLRAKNQQLKTDELMAAAQAKITREVEAEIAAEARRQSATQLGSQLQSRFGGGNLTEAETARVGVAIGQITAQVNKGAISAQEALGVINQVAAGQAGVWEGAAARIASATSRIRGATAATEEDLESELSGMTMSIRELEDETTRAAASGQRATTRLIIGWQELGRLFLIQSLHTLVRKFFDAMHSAIQETAEFQVRISELRTISQGANISFDQWADSIRNVAMSYGISQADAAEGAYQALSNQVVKGADAANFLSKAMAFAKTTNSSTKESVDLLTGALNSFHLGVESTDRVAAQLFKTITLGHVRSNEMAETFGRIGSLAYPLGVSLEEVGGGIATLSKQGIKFNESATLINRVMTKLLSPTSEMKELFTHLGVSSGPQAIAVFHGLGNVLQEMEKYAKGSDSEIAKLLGNIRAIRGDLALSGANAPDFASATEQIGKGQAEYLEAQKRAMESVGAQWIKDWENLKTHFSAVVGDPLDAKIEHLTHMLGGKDGLVGAFDLLGPVITESAKLFLLYEGVTHLASVSSRSLAIVTSTQAEAQGATRNYTTLTTAALREQVLANEELVVATQARLELESITPAGVSIASRNVDTAVADLEQQRIATQAELTAGTITQAEADIRLTAAEADVVTTQAALVAEEATLSEEQQARIATLRTQIATTEASTAAHESNAASLIALAGSEEEVGASAVLMGRAWAFASSLMTWTNLALVAGLAIYEIIHHWDDAEIEFEATVKKGKEAAQAAARETTNEINGQLAEQTEEFNKHLEQRFRDYEVFGAEVARLAADLTDDLKIAADDAREGAKKAIDGVVRDYQTGINQIEDAHRRAIDNIRRLEEDMDKTREDFANKEFRRQMQIAEWKDRQAIPGKSGKMADQNTIDLVIAEEKRLKDANANLLKPTGNAKKDADQITMAQKNAKQIGELEQQLFDKRLRMEEERKRTAEQVADAETKAAAKKAERQSADDASVAKESKIEEDRNARDQIRDMRGPGRHPDITEIRKNKTEADDSLSDTRRAALTKEQQTRQDAEDEVAASRLANLKAQLASQDAALVALPQINEFQARSNKLLQENLDLKKQAIKSQQALADSADVAEKKSKADFAALRATLAEIEKFKIEPTKIKEQKDITIALARWDSLIKKASDQGLKDGSAQLHLAEEKTAFEAKAQATLIQVRTKADNEQFLQQKKNAAILYGDLTKQLVTKSGETQQLFGNVTGITGTKKDLGELEGFINKVMDPGAGDFPDEARADKNKTAVSAADSLREMILDLQRDAAELAKTGKSIDPNKIEVAKAKIQDYIATISEGVNYSGERKDLKDVTVSTTTDARGNVSTRTLQDVSNDLNNFINTFQKQTKGQEDLIAKRAKAQKDLDEATQGLKTVADKAKELGIGLDQAKDAAKSMADTIKALVTDLDQLKTAIQKLKPAPVPGHAAGGFISSGTDTIPAMLTPGEFVINADATSKYHSMLESINNGFSPNIQASRPSLGDLGSVGGSNYHFHGDIKATVMASGNERYDAQALGQALRAELRRGTISWDTQNG